MTLVQDNSVQAINTALLSIKRDISALTATTAGTTAGLEPGKTYNINISGNAETATTAKTARTATNANHAETAETATKMSNALTVNGKTYNGSEAVDAGVQTVANGGTGATDAASGFNTLADGVRDSTTPGDNEKMLLKPTGTWYKTTCLDFWNYIKGKISSVLGLTKDNYGGKAASAGTADKVGNYPASDLWRSDGATWNPQANVSLNAAANGDEWSFDIRRNGHTGCYWHVWDSSHGSLLRVDADDGRVTALKGFKANNKMVIPIGAPSSLEDGCIWIER